MRAFARQSKRAGTDSSRIVRPWAARLLALAALMAVGHFTSELGAGSARGQSEPQRISARGRFEVLATQRDRATGRPRAETYVTLGDGEGASRYLAAGSADAPDICQAGFVNEPSSVHPMFLWRLDTQVLGVSSTATTLQLRWSRSRTIQGRTEADQGDTRTLTLGLGEYHVFDYVAAAPDSPSSCANLVLRILAEPVPRPDPQPLLAVDLWLVDETDSGQRWVHQQVKGRSGQPLPFRLDALKWSPSGSRSHADAVGPSIGLDVRGTVNATLRPDGPVDVSIRAARSVTWGGARLSGEGQQEFRCAFGESVAILLPDPVGEAASRSTAAAGAKFAEGVFARGETTVVDFARFFAGRQTSLYVVVSRPR